MLWSRLSLLWLGSCSRLGFFHFSFRCSLRRRLSFLGRSFLRRSIGGCSGSWLAVRVDLKEVSANVDRVTLLCQVLCDDTGVSCEDVNCDLVSLDLGNWLICVHKIAGFFDEGQDNTI